MRAQKVVWRPAPGWPEPPRGWQPPPGWEPPADWPPAPADWEFWVPEQHEPVAPVRYREPDRRDLVIETWVVMIAMLTPWVISAVVVLGAHLATGASLNPLPTFDKHEPAVNVVLGLLSYVPTVAVVPLALFLLARTGQSPAVLGLTRAGWSDVGAGLGLAAAALGCEFVLAILLAPIEHSKLANTTGPLHVPAYYIVFGISQSLLTSIAEETAVNGYLITRLDQLGWSPTAAFWLSLALRTSYHVYYGIGLVFTLPFGYLVTRSFQKHRKLSRPILAHFLYDTTVFLISILVH
ncbi:MAG TPA: CPBP family intramembrane glutamic endopeptidase [Streptosporangiaceae bacterium]|nr:CPBP family intramembrane glutamic endopeptidase [Streptosporangiaceae bacterium]